MFETVSNHSLKTVGVLTISFTRHDIDMSWHGNIYISSVTEHDSVTEGITPNFKVRLKY